MQIYTVIEADTQVPVCDGIKDRSDAIKIAAKSKRNDGRDYAVIGTLTETIFSTQATHNLLSSL
ncbi:hypothetical protein HB779_17465 [Phyllobacterium sp. 628]|uniref:hypothetical protein n=1 Tax=Phyllobacterium sp. 628 TaxID=2718938 RepID=UPI00166257E0|nr:hypothetical protein [Phyllobacterium sp. 628]QND53476.1 hypothetical protein HB779_17465 [Phyllobacterium sp. 628]